METKKYAKLWLYEFLTVFKMCLSDRYTATYVLISSKLSPKLKLKQKIQENSENTPFPPQGGNIFKNKDLSLLADVQQLFYRPNIEELFKRKKTKKSLSKLIHY